MKEAGRERVLVSIVTPTLNRGPFIADTLRSVAAQTYGNIEHLVVDGGSTDDTSNIVAKLALPRVRWSSQPDHGMYDAINRGLEMANGEIFGYLNSDDLYFPWTIATVVEGFRRHPEVDVLYGDAIRMDEETHTYSPWLQTRFNRRRTGAWGSLIQPAVFWRSRLTAELGKFDASLRFVADLDFWLRAGKGNVFGQVDELLAIDRTHSTSASVALREEMSVEDTAIRARHLPTASTFVKAAVRAGAAIERRHRWLAFVLASRGKGKGWDRAVKQLQPSIDTKTAVRVLLPGLSRRSLREVRFGADPIRVSTQAVHPWPHEGIE